MVYHDGSAEINLRKSQSLAPATVLERVFSFFLDYLILAPAVSFINLLIFKNEMIAWRNVGSSAAFGAESAPLFFSICAFFIILFSAMQAIFIWKWQATPGQYFLKIKVEFNPQIGLSFLRILIRQLSFWLSIALLGIPFLAVMGHPDGKTFYDRLTETQIKSLKKNPVRFTFETEGQYWRSLISTLSVFVFILVAATSWNTHTNIRNKTYSFMKKQKANYFCSELRTVDMRDRLQTVIALNLVGQIEDICVDKEADFVLWKSADEAQRSLAYYAKSLTENETDDAQEREYIKQACAGKLKSQLGCQIANAFQTDTLENFYTKLSTSEDADNLLLSTLKYELSNMLDKTEMTTEHLNQLKAYDELKVVKKYLLSELVNRSITNQSRSPASVPAQDVSYMKKLMDDL